MNSIARLLKTLFCIATVAFMAGCATGPKFSDTATSMPSLRPGDGRIFFYRSSSMLGAAIQPDVKLNNEVVGSSKPGGYFWVDRPAGNYVASASTETEKTATFALAAGETKYLKTSPSFGIIVGRIVISLESPEAARAELASLSYTGASAKR
ncbi:MAG: DUF2846 domain-containing protein [Caldimonas sp.]